MNRTSPGIIKTGFVAYALHLSAPLANKTGTENRFRAYPTPYGASPRNLITIAPEKRFGDQVCHIRL